MGLLVVGSVAFDSVKTPFGEAENVLGGSATYFSVAASFFTQVSLVAVVGQDCPEEHVRFLKSRKIDCDGLERAAGKTFRWKGEYSFQLNEAQTLDTQLNVLQNFWPKLPEKYKSHEIVFLANIDPDLQSEVLAQMKRPAVVACDTMNYWITSKPEALKKLLGKVNIFFANEEEAKKLTRQSNALRAANTICEWGPSVVVIKKGEHGALLKVGRKTYAFPAFPLETVKDPTGAGDTFAGGFLGYLASCNGFSDVAELKRAMLYGTIMASFTVEEFSTRALEDLRQRELRARFEDLVERLTIPQDALISAN